jgi:hypothetical protein
MGGRAIYVGLLKRSAVFEATKICLSFSPSMADAKLSADATENLTYLEEFEITGRAVHAVARKSDRRRRTDEKIVSVLEARFKENLIYTFVGKTLIALNPYKILTEDGTDNGRPIYDRAIANLYYDEVPKLPPHVFQVMCHWRRQPSARALMLTARCVPRWRLRRTATSCSSTKAPASW